MEQTNLVVSPDGKTWDEVTRDVSYIGGSGIRTDLGSNWNTVGTLVFTDWRGTVDTYNTTTTGTTGEPWHNKDFAIAYDRVICLKAGKYLIQYQSHVDIEISTSTWAEIKKNGTAIVQAYMQDANYSQVPIFGVVHLVRGDYIQITGSGRGDAPHKAVFNITQV